MQSRFIKLPFLIVVFCTFPFLASAQVWQDISTVNTAIASKTQTQLKTPTSMTWARKVDTDLEGLKFILNKAPHERLGSSDVTLDLPLPDGGSATFTLLNSPIIEPGLSQKYPDIQTFRVVDKHNLHNTGRVELTSRGFRGMFRYNGDLVYIDPVKNQNGFHTYFESDYAALEKKEPSPEASCGFDEHEMNKDFTPLPRNDKAFQTPQKIALGGNLRTYRFAVATTGEYTQELGGGTLGGGLAAVVSAVNRVNVFLETDVAIRLILIANNDAIIFTDPNTDPFTDQSRTGVMTDSHGVITASIGVENFDIGHVFGTFGGGVVSGSNVCVDSRKGSGVTGIGNAGEIRFINFLAHELGHQFSAPHSFNGSTGACTSIQRKSIGSVEPHSGSTFMSYIGVCGEENLKGVRGRFFHNSSMTFITDFVADSSTGGSCGAPLATTNSGPVIDAGADGTIPMSTPFTLSGQARDADGDGLVHIWEQVDLGAPNASAADFADEGTRPLFRSFTPSTALSRTFPQLERILAGDRVIGEVLPSTDRDLTFRMTTRDGVGGVADDERIISVTTAAGPFTIETPANASLRAGVSHTVIWDVANTASAPVNCATVNLSLSTDGGNSFNYELAASTPNDGSAMVMFPNVTTSTGRLRASCNNQPFFAINDTNFTMTPMSIVNAAPDAVEDTASIVQDSRRIPIAVLANDTDPDGDALTLASVTQPNQNGETEISGSNVLYTPVIGFTGTETFTYTVNDGNNNSSSAVVIVTVTPKSNNAPVVENVTFTLNENSPASVINVLSGASDKDGDTLTLQSVSAPSNGGSARINNGQIVYTPATNYSGTETFTFTVSDGEGGETTANVTVTVLMLQREATVTDSNLTQSGRGGGPIGPFLLLILALRGYFERRRSVGAGALRSFPKI